jgi:hypothetical protein
MNKQKLLEWIDARCYSVERADCYTDDYVRGYQEALSGIKELINLLPDEKKGE